MRQKAFDALIHTAMVAALLYIIWCFFSSLLDLMYWIGV